MNRLIVLDSSRRRCHGFTLLELAIVMTIVGYLIKQFVVPFGARLEQSRRTETRAQIELIIEASIGFAAANHRLPCPASTNSSGFELSECSGADAFGYVPVATLGLQGYLDAQGRLLDSWGSPILYSVSWSDHPDHGQFGQTDYTTTGEMSAVGMRYLSSNISVCQVAVQSTCPATQMLANQVPLIVLSTGRDISIQNHQSENQNGDSVFVHQPYSANSEIPFDDIVIWLSENLLFYRLIQAGVLP